MREQPESESASPTRSNDVEMASLLASGSPPEQDELEIPPLTTYVSTWRFWWKFLKCPVGFLVANSLVIFISVMLFMEEEQARPKMVAFFSILTALLLVDTFALHQAARHVEKQVSRLEEESSESSFWSPHLVSAKVSKQLDSFFGQQRAIPKVTFLVNFLFALCALSLSASAMSVASIGFLVSPQGQKACFKQQEQSSTRALPVPGNDDEVRSVPNGDFEPPIAGIPSDLKRWAYEGSHYRGYDDNTYIHLSNGWTFFAGSKLMEDREDGMDDAPPGRTLVGVAPNGTLKEYSDIRSPRSFVVINNRTNEFCCFYDKALERRPRRHWEDRNENMNVLCYQESDLRSAAWKWRHSRYEYLSDMAMTYHKGILWLRLQKYNGRGDGEYVQIGTMNLKTMNVSDVTTLDISYHSRHGRHYRDDACLESVWWLHLFVGFIVSVVTSVWLLKHKEIPSGVTPVCVLTCLTLFALNDQVGYTLGFFGAIGVTLSLMTASAISRGQRDMLLWTLYTTLLVMAVQVTFSNDRFYDPFVAIVPLVILAVTIGLLLNHPILQVLGWLGVIISVVVAMIAFFSSDVETLFMIAPLCFVLSCGLAALGYKLAKCRPYFVVYARRVWRAMEVAEARTGHRSSGRTDETGLREGLLRNQL